MHETSTTRKLSKPMRVANYIYQVLMGILAGVSFMLTQFDEIPKVFYEIVAVFSSAFPIVWSKILDASKHYHEQQTPPYSPADTPHTDSPQPPTVMTSEPMRARASSEPQPINQV